MAHNGTYHSLSMAIFEFCEDMVQILLMLKTLLKSGTEPCFVSITDVLFCFCLSVILSKMTFSITLLG